MKNVIVGTAGHIDHGKTTLIKALTGRSTDRLKEEKERGISIELGFTYFDLPSGKRAGIIDVPGHEKFIKNMLAGAASVDVVVLVIAADEGVMPQTREHMNILSMLKVKKGIIALTKKDMVDPEWLEMIAEQIREEVSHTFLKEANIIPVSSITGDGMGDLINEIDRITDIVEQKDTQTVFRLPIDRVFSISGFGTVVTGTLLSGTINEGDKIEVYPQNIESRVRSIQVHDKNAKTAYAGQRVALNIANVKVEEIERGSVIAKPGSLENTMMIDARLELLADAERSIDNRDRLRLYHETSEIMCRVVLLDREELKPGEDAFVQLRLEESMACQKGDRFVIRFYSPMVTIGGGTVLDANPPKRKRFKEDVLEELKIKEQGDPSDIVEQYILKLSNDFPERRELLKITGNMSVDKFDDIIDELKQEDLVVSFKLGADVHFAHKSYLNDLGSKINDILKSFHDKNPLKYGISKEELKSKALEDMKQRLSDAVFAYFEASNVIKIHGQYVSLKEFEISFNKAQSEIKDFLLKKFRENKYNPPKLSELIQIMNFDKNEIQKVYNSLIDIGELVKVDEEIVFAREAYSQSIDVLKTFINENKSIQLGEFRDLLGTSRKYAIALLDYFDQNKITKRQEDKRILF